ncbi:hypothetical protein BFL43_01830 [Williamsia sp. 1135]|nr:hypothetical protein BFL43_01830 [Williamsia sp. 1135]
MKPNVTDVTRRQFGLEKATPKYASPPTKAQITRVLPTTRPSPTLGPRTSEEMHPMPYRDAALAAKGVAAIHLSDGRFTVPAALAADISRQLESAPESTRAVVLTLSDDACILIAPGDPLVIFVPRTAIGAEG